MRPLAGVLVLMVVAVLTGCRPDAGTVAAPTPVTTPTMTVAPCPSGSVVAQVQPPERRLVRLRISDASGRPDLATTIATEFRDRGLQVVGVGPEEARYDGVVILRYGPPAVGAAWDVEPFFLFGPARTSRPWRVDFQLTRSDNVVAVVLGAAFTNLGTVTEVNQATALLGQPTAPPGTCAAPTG